MASKIETEIREEFMSAVRELFEGKGEDVLQVKSELFLFRGCVVMTRDI